MISLQRIRPKRMSTTPEENPKNAIRLLAPFGHDIVPRRIKTPRPLRNRIFIVARFSFHLHDLEPVEQELAHHVLHCHKRVRPLPDIPARERANGVLGQCCGAVEVDAAAGLEDVIDGARETAVFREVFDDAEGDGVVVWLVGFMGEEVLQVDGAREILFLDETLDVACAVWGEGERCDVYTTRTAVLRDAAPAAADVEDAHARLQAEAVPHYVEFIAGCLFDCFVSVFEEAVRVEAELLVDEGVVQVVAAVVVRDDGLRVHLCCGPGVVV